MRSPDQSTMLWPRLVHKIFGVKRRFDRFVYRINCRLVARKYRAYSMIPSEIFVENLQLLARVRDVPGCVVECGVWRGGMSAGMADILGPLRHYYLFDSFKGMPPAKEVDGSAALRWEKDRESPSYFDNCLVDVQVAKTAMAMSPAKRVSYMQGWFNETLPGFVPEDGIAVLRLDGDWYESTMQCLTALYKSVVPGGLIIVDDYYAFDGCSRAVHDFLSQNMLPDKIQMATTGVCYIVRPVL